MPQTLSRLAVLLAIPCILLAPACESVGDIGPAGGVVQPPPNQPGSGSGGSLIPISNGSGGAGGSTVVASGLPCDVQSLLFSRCATCHASPPLAGCPCRS